MKITRYILLPIAALYSTAVRIRNLLYDLNISKSSKGAITSLVIGNLTVGGTGKTPMAEFIINALKDEFKIAFLSRGYKRKTKSCMIATENATSADIGDEPEQIHRKFPDIPVAVCADRLKGLEMLKNSHPGLELAVLDDALQHRRLKPDLTIMLTDYNNFFLNDFFIPAGRLRDNKYRYKHVDFIVVTKCPPTLKAKQKNKIIKSLGNKRKDRIFFASIEYGQPVNIFNGEAPDKDLSQYSILGVSGIANPLPFENHIKQLAGKETFFIRFLDHKHYSNDSIKKIFSTFDQIYTSEKIILTTEKDAVKIAELELKEEQKNVLYYIPIQTKILFDEGEKFKHQIKSHARKLVTKNQQSRQVPTGSDQ